MQQKVVLKNEVVKVKGRVKAVTVKKEDFDKFLKLVKLRVFDKSYEALMPPLDDMTKNTIDIGGLAQQVQNYLSIVLFGGGSTTSVQPAQMVLTTSSGSTITLQYTNKITLNTIGVTMYMQYFEDNNSYTFQYYYVGFDTSNNSYSITQAELYVSQEIGSGSSEVYTPLIRIAYASIGITKSSSEYLFIAWLIEFENIPPYLMYFMPVFQNNLNIYVYPSANSYAYINVYNGNCTLSCGGNCPSQNFGAFLVYTQNNNVVVEFPFQFSISSGVTTVEVMLCTQMEYVNWGSPYTLISGSTSATITPPVTGAIYYAVILTVTITYTAS